MNKLRLFCIVLLFIGVPTIKTNAATTKFTSFFSSFFSSKNSETNNDNSETNNDDFESPDSPQFEDFEPQNNTDREQELFNLIYESEEDAAISLIKTGAITNFNVRFTPYKKDNESTYSLLELAVNRKLKNVVLALLAIPNCTISPEKPSNEISIFSFMPPPMRKDTELINALLLKIRRL